MVLPFHRTLTCRAKIYIAFVSRSLHKYSCLLVPDPWHFRNSGKQDADYSSFASGYPAGFDNFHLSGVLV